MRMKLLIIGFFAAITIVPMGIANAQTNNSNSTSRLSVVRQTQNITLDETAKAKIVGACKDAQDSVQIVKQRNEKQSKLRLETYKDVGNEALALNIRIKRQGVNTAATGQTLITYKQHVTEFEDLEKSYQQTLGDTIAIDCQQNPELFKAGLELARQTQAQLLNKTEEIRIFIVKDIDTAFNDLKGKLSS